MCASIFQPAGLQELMRQAFLADKNDMQMRCGRLASLAVRVHFRCQVTSRIARKNDPPKGWVHRDGDRNAQFDHMGCKRGTQGPTSPGNFRSLWSIRQVRSLAEAFVFLGFRFRLHAPMMTSFRQLCRLYKNCSLLERLTLTIPSLHPILKRETSDICKL